MKVKYLRGGVGTVELAPMAEMEREPLRAGIAILEAWIGGQVRSVVGEAPPAVDLPILAPVKQALTAGEPLKLDAAQATALQAAAWSLYRWAVKSLVATEDWSVYYPRHVGEFGWAWMVEWDEVFSSIRRWASGAVHEGPFLVERVDRDNQTLLRLSIKVHDKELPAADLREAWERVGALLGDGDVVVIV